METKTRLSEWLSSQLEQRGWSHSDLARRAGVTRAQVSRVISETRGAGPEFCVAIARALNESPIKIFQLAGLLPYRADPDEDPRLRTLNYKFSLLDEQGKAELERYLDYLLTINEQGTR
jgi:transcriptional regulator with XRE-family HTH domain